MEKEDLIICPKCGRKAWIPDRVKRVGKNPDVIFWYMRYRHPKRYGKNEVHYARVDPESKKKAPLAVMEDKEVDELEKAVELVQKRRRLKSIEG